VQRDANKAASPAAAIGDEELQIKLVLGSGVDVDAAAHGLLERFFSFVGANRFILRFCKPRGKGTEREATIFRLVSPASMSRF
jgi:hypothetical protein